MIERDLVEETESLFALDGMHGLSLDGSTGASGIQGAIVPAAVVRLEYLPIAGPEPGGL